MVTMHRACSVKQNSLCGYSTTHTRTAHVTVCIQTKQVIQPLHATRILLSLRFIAVHLNNSYQIDFDRNPHIPRAMCHAKLFIDLQSNVTSLLSIYSLNNATHSLI